MSQYIIALDQGTSSSRAVLFDDNAQIVDIAQQEFTQHYPKAGWVEHDPLEIWQSQSTVLQQVIDNNKLKGADIAAIGITNQRETTVVWDKNTGNPVHNAIVWQDKRTSDTCDSAKTGLVVDSYFSGTKVQWILDNTPSARKAAEKGDLLFGTIDTWLIWNLTNKKVHATDSSNASRTMLFNIETQEWDEELLEALNVPSEILPTVQDSDAHFGDFELDDVKIPITGVIGDQQAALFGQLAWQQGEAKNTYGTGCFMLLNTGKDQIKSQFGLLTTVAWRRANTVNYALEGSVFIAGAAIQWLRDAMQVIDSAKETEALANEADEDDEVVVVPAFAGLGAPYWDMNARGAVFGLTRGAGKAELVKATLQSLALQTYDVIDAMLKDSKIDLRSLRVDGGAIANNYLAQFQADILDITGLGAKLWSEEFLQKQRSVDTVFESSMQDEKRKEYLNQWHKAVSRTRGWLDSEK